MRAITQSSRYSEQPLFSLYGIKVWADGSNQAETAWQTKPYLNTNLRGTAGYKSEQMLEICKNAKAAGWTMLAHCQGDAAVEQYLNALEAAYGANPSTGLNRIEHATMARQDQIDRMKRLGYEPSFMTDFIYLYGDAYRDTIFGNPRASFAVPFGAAAKANLNYTVHSDNPAAGMPLNPMRHVEIQLMRRCIVDNSIIGPDQRVDIQHAMRAISMHAARQIGLGESLGTLDVGKDADITILESDPFTTSPDKISSIKASQTWVAGKKMYG
ncbi:MAG: amidohydrolase family protein [Polynucleobacter sp.]|nr:amidohydrolase family protein [Polynucleobacter sp.]